MTAVEYEILKLLCDADGIPLSMDTLQKRTILHKQFTFEEIDPLAQRALIEVICDTAGVPYMIRIQAGGKEVVKDIEFRTNPDLELVKGKINSNEARILNLLLDKLKA